MGTSLSVCRKVKRRDVAGPSGLKVMSCTW